LQSSCFSRGRGGGGEGGVRWRKTYPIVDMLLDGNKIGTFSAARRQITKIKGMELCPQPGRLLRAAARGNLMHKMGCKGKELEAQRQQSREFAKCKDFDKLLGASRAQAQALRIGKGLWRDRLQAGRQGHEELKMNFCKNFNAKAVPCQGECMAYPCCEWPEIMDTELDGTFYTELPAFRWPKAPSAGRRGRARAPRRSARCGAPRATVPSTRRCEELLRAGCVKGVWRGAL